MEVVVSLAIRYFYNSCPSTFVTLTPTPTSTITDINQKQAMSPTTIPLTPRGGFYPALENFSGIGSLRLQSVSATHDFQDYSVEELLLNEYSKGRAPTWDIQTCDPFLDDPMDWEFDSNWVDDNSQRVVVSHIFFPVH